MNPVEACYGFRTLFPLTIIPLSSYVVVILDAKKREKEMMHIQAKVTESIEKTIQRWPFERIEGERK